jgi:hypothetical protein
MALVMLAFFLGSCADRHPPPFSDPDADMSALAQRAVDEARRLDGTVLGFESDSIEHVEVVLGAYHELYRTGELADRRLRIEALRWGAYIGETIKRETGEGSWAKDHPVAGVDTFPLNYRGGDSFPVLWAHRRITDGPEANVWHKYRHFVRGEASPEWEIIEHPMAAPSPVATVERD